MSARARRIFDSAFACGAKAQSSRAEISVVVACSAAHLETLFRV